MNTDRPTKRVSIYINLRGQNVEVECFPTTGDSSVGLDRDFEDEIVFDEGGGELAWELTDKERESINHALDNWAAEGTEATW